MVNFTKRKRRRKNLQSEQSDIFHVDMVLSKCRVWFHFKMQNSTNSMAGTFNGEDFHSVASLWWV